MTKARDIADFKFENIVDTGTEGTKVATGTSAQRGTTAGQLRFNTDTGLAEYYTGAGFKSIDSPPTIQSISPTTESDANANITITGSNFSSGATVKFIGNDGTEYSSPSVTVNSTTQITATTPSSPLPVANEPYDIQVTNISGLSITLADSLDAGGVPAWNTASGQIGGTLLEGETINVSVSATDPDGTAITYSEVTSVLGANGLSLNSSTGAITGTLPSVSSDTTISFTIRATAGSDSTDRAFNIVNKNNNPPVFDVASGSLGTLYDSSRSSSALTAITATDPEGTSVTFAVTSGSIPSGLTFNSDGTWSGTANAVGSDATSTFTVTATSGGLTATREYTITVKAPVIEAFTSGSGTWNRPSGMTSTTQIKLLIVGGGGGAGGSRTGDPSGGGGAGGLILVTNFVTAQSSYTYSIGNGGQGGQGGSSYGSDGGNTTFSSSGIGTFTANGGGGGGGTTYGQSVHGRNGGSGGGSGSYNGNGGFSNIASNYTIDGTTYSGVGFGNAGSGGNGGAGGGAGGGASGNSGGAGKNVSSDFGTSYGNSGVFAKGGSDGGNANGGANTGDGASSAFSTAPNRNGGSGIILIAY
jgi:hypothetical protein